MTDLLPRNFFIANDKLLDSSFVLNKWNTNLSYYNHLFEEYEKLYRKKTGIKNVKNTKLKSEELQKKQILNQPIKKLSLDRSTKNARQNKSI